MREWLPCGEIAERLRLVEHGTDTAIGGADTDSCEAESDTACES